MGMNGEANGDRFILYSVRLTADGAACEYAHHIVTTHT